MGSRKPFALWEAQRASGAVDLYGRKTSQFHAQMNR